MEQPRKEGAEDTLMWFCQTPGCNSVVWQKRFICTDLGTQIKEVVEEFGGDEKKKTCKKCGKVAKTKYDNGEVVQPPRFPE